MNYQGYLISDWATGIDKALQPWLSPDDSQFELFDGYVYKGVWQKREGYSQFATGQRTGSPYCESRMVHRVTAEILGAADGVITVFNNFLAEQPIRRGTVTVSYIIGAVPLTAVDNGLGAFTGTSVDVTPVDTYIDYTTGEIQITFTTAPDAATNVTVTYDEHQGLPVMGVMNYFTQINTKELIVADTRYINRYNAVTNRLDDISPAVLLSGDKTKFMSWCNYPTPNNLQRLLFVNFEDPIQSYDGNSVELYPIYTTSSQITNVPSGVIGNGTVGPYTITTPASTGIVPGSLSILEPVSGQTVTDDLFGNLQGDGNGTVDYLSGTIVVTFNALIAAPNPINLTYKQLADPIETALHIYPFKDRLVVHYTIENGVQYGLRIRVSGTGAFGDVFTTDAIGAGVIDVPDSSFISSGDFNRDDLLFFTKNSTWGQKYTGNDVIPFELSRIDGTRGSEAPYGTITYLNKTDARSTLGFIITDGYSVVRSDDKIPEYSNNEINQNLFNLCFAGTVDTDKDHYLIHPSVGADKSDRILVSNYEEGNYAVYRIPLSCMGTFIVSFDISWNDLLIYKTWDEMASVYGDWNSFAYSKGAPIAIGGGHEGQIVRLNDIETEDYPVKIRNITIVDSATLQVTTDFQTFQVNDYIAIESVNGMTEVNNKQAQIKTVISNYVFNLQIDTSGFSLYPDDGTGTGMASKCIIFDSKTKKFNPFANMDKKVSCGWLYFYVSTTGTDLTVNKFIFGATKSDPCVLDVPGHGYTTGAQVYIDGVQGMTQLNGSYYYISVVNQNKISLDGVNSSGYTDYVSGGFTSVPEQANLQVRCIINDTEQSTLVNGFNPAPYQVNLSNQISENGIKKWYKIWINQVARFVQFQVLNNQSGSKVQIHAMMPGFAGVGRLI